MALDATAWRLSRRFFDDWVRPRWRRLTVVVALMVLVAATTGAYPLVIDFAFDLLTAADSRVVWLIPPVVIGLTLVKGLALYFQMVTTQALVQRVIKSVQTAMYDHLLAADLSRLMREPTGRLISRFTNDVQLIRESLFKCAVGLIREVLTVIALVGAMIYLDWVLTLIVFAVYPLAAIPIQRVSKHLRRVSHGLQAQTGDVTSFLQQSFDGARMVKAYNLEDYQRERADETFDQMRKHAMRAHKARARIDPVMEVLGGLAVAGVLAVGGWRVTTGAGTVGEFSGFIAALLMAAQPIRALGTLQVALQEGLAAIQRAYTLLDERPLIQEPPNAPALRCTAAKIAFEDVRFSYGDDVAALDGIDLVCEPGKTTALVGPSGAGKSTILNLIPRFFDVTEGRVTIDGMDIRDVSVASLRRSMSLVSQEVVLFDDSVFANIAFGQPGADEHAVRDAAEAAAASEFIGAFPDGYATRVGEQGSRLSGGQRQRVALARAILRDAPILLLDEATSALDAESERQVQQALERLASGRTTVVIAHRLATVQKADRILVLDGGAVVESGTHAELMAAGGLYARLCQMQVFTADVA